MLNHKNNSMIQAPFLGSEWIVTDGDCCQMIRPIAGSLPVKAFECYQITSYPGHFSQGKHKDRDYFKIQHATIDLEYYDADEIVSVLNSFGFKNMDDFAEWEQPRLSEEVCNRLVAEMLFENDCQTTEYDEAEEYHSWNSAVSALEKKTGVDLSDYKN